MRLGRGHAGAGLTAAAFLTFLALTPAGTPGVAWVSDLTQFAAAAAASVSAWRASRVAVESASTWRCLAVATGAWAIGELLWTYYDLVSAQAPFPSAADVGFLCFPLASIWALWQLGGRDHLSGRLRQLADGALVATSLLLVSWVTVLEAVVRAGADTGLGLLVLVAYPIGDVVLGTLLLTSLPNRGLLGLRPFWLLFAGLAALAVGDSGFAYLNAVGWYSSGSLIDAGWVTGFGLLWLAGRAARGASVRPEADGASPEQSRLLLSLPYLATAIAVVVVAPSLPSGLSPMEAALGAGVFGTALLRQWLMVADNQALMRVVHAREDQLRHQAFHDGLTGLANRVLFHRRIGQALARHDRSGRAVSVLYLDLDGFKRVNDLHGHQVGDALLTAVAVRLRGLLRPGDILARLGGDEFGLLLEDDADPGPVAARVVELVQQPFLLGQVTVRVGASIGIKTLRTPERADADQLIREADHAMYVAKRGGRDRVAVHDPAAAVDAGLAAELAAAVRDDLVQVAYQPVVDLVASRVVAVEALARWHHPQLGTVPPAVFIPIATRHDLLQGLTRNLVHRTLGDTTGLVAGGLQLAINVTPGVLLMPGFAAELVAALDAHDVPAEALSLELTETDPTEQLDRLGAVLGELAGLGMQLSLDDFGTGHNNLGLLEALPVHQLKSDRSALQHCLHEPSTSMVRVIRDLAALRGYEYVVEGVETADELAAVRSLGITRAQGFLFSPAVPVQQLRAALAERPAGSLLAI